MHLTSSSNDWFARVTETELNALTSNMTELLTEKPLKHPREVSYTLDQMKLSIQRHSQSEKESD